MAFSEAIKLEAKRRAHFRCVACRDPFVEVHHIIPQADSGPDTLDNAAPLCARCHDLIGGNRDKRKQLREMRDFWWEICAQQQPWNLEILKKLDEVMTQGKDTALDIAETKNLVIMFYQQPIERVKAASTMSEVIAVSGTSGYGGPIMPGQDGYSGITCRNCGMSIRIPEDGDACPRCGRKIESE